VEPSIMPPITNATQITMKRKNKASLSIDVSGVS
jgi:hypothetical protein